MGGDSLGFYNLEGSDLNSAARQFFRVSIGGNEKYFVKIDQKKYSLVDVSVNGVSFYVNSGTEFPIGTKWLCGLIWDNLGSEKEKLIASGFETLKKDILVKNL